MTAKPIVLEPKQIREAPSQDKCKEEITSLNSKISGYRTLQNSGLALVSHKEIKNLMDEKSSKEKNLKRLQKKSAWARNDRLKKKENIRKLCETDENAAKILKSSNRGIPGRPRLETDQPELLSTILDIVQGSASCAEEVNI